MSDRKVKYRKLMRSTTSIVTQIWCWLLGIARGALTMGALTLVVFITLHLANIPTGGKTTWYILGGLAILALARGVYVSKSELWRLEHYKILK